MAVIGGCIFFSSCMNVLELKIVPFYFRHFRTDFYTYMFTSIVCLCMGAADGLLISILFSLLWILRRSSHPIWTLKEFLPSDPDDDRP